MTSYASLQAFTLKFIWYFFQIVGTDSTPVLSFPLFANILYSLLLIRQYVMNYYLAYPTKLGGWWHWLYLVLELHSPCLLFFHCICYQRTKFQGQTIKSPKLLDNPAYGVVCFDNRILKATFGCKFSMFIMIHQPSFFMSQYKRTLGFVVSITFCMCDQQSFHLYCSLSNLL